MADQVPVTYGGFKISRQRCNESIVEKSLLVGAPFVNNNAHLAEFNCTAETGNKSVLLPSLSDTATMVQQASAGAIAYDSVNDRVVIKTASSLVHVVQSLGIFECTVTNLDTTTKLCKWGNSAFVAALNMDNQDQFDEPSSIWVVPYNCTLKALCAIEDDTQPMESSPLTLIMQLQVKRGGETVLDITETHAIKPSTSVVQSRTVNAFSIGWQDIDTTSSDSISFSTTNDTIGSVTASGSGYIIQTTGANNDWQCYTNTFTTLSLNYNAAPGGDFYLGLDNNPGSNALADNINFCFYCSSTGYVAACRSIDDVNHTMEYYTGSAWSTTITYLDTFTAADVMEISYTAGGVQWTITDAAGVQQHTITYDFASDENGHYHSGMAMGVDTSFMGTSSIVVNSLVSSGSAQASLKIQQNDVLRVYARLHEDTYTYYPAAQFNPPEAKIQLAVQPT